MDLNEAWKKINEEKFSSTTIKKEEIMEAITKESSLTVSELKKRLQYKLYWVYFFLAAFSAGILFNLDNTKNLILFGFFFVLYIFAALGLYGQIENMDDLIDTSKDTLTEMKKHRDIIKQALKNEARWGLFSLPMIIIAMFILPPLLDGTPLLEIIMSKKFVIKMIVGMGIILPIVHWGATKMNEKAYGSHIQQLEENIQKMEEL